MFEQRFSFPMPVLLLLGMLLAGCTAPSTSVALPSGRNAEWHLVVIGDSSMWEHGKAIASQIEKDRGVKVVLDDFALPSLRASMVREVLETGKSSNARLEKLPDALRDAEIVVMFVNPMGSIVPESTNNIESCLLASPPENCSLESFAAYTTDLKAIWAKIIALRKGKATILRATDIYNPLVRNWNEAGVFDDCTTCWSNQSTAARQAAEAYSIPFISRYDAFNGASHTEDPRDKGLIREDGEHPTELMGAEFASLLARLGYDPVSPPR
jgi:hypothetical protein